MNLNGTWKGVYTYGDGYPPEMIGRSDPFEFTIREKKGLFTGTCIDNVVKKTAGNESFIEGNYAGGYISFLKTYKYHMTIKEPQDDEPFEFVASEGIQYTGTLYRKYLIFQPYFEGEWAITVSYRQKMTGEFFYHTVHGSWQMKKG